MARRWTHEEEARHRVELEDLYVTKNKTIHEIAIVLNLKFQTVYDRLLRLGIKTLRSKKTKYNNTRNDTYAPVKHTPQLAELCGILMGDGHVSHFQVLVTLGSKEHAYACHVQKLVHTVFGGTPRITIRKLGKNKGHRTVYLGSTYITDWLYKEGFVTNKVRAQVDAPQWIFDDPSFMHAFLRGFFDTDGSVYKLRYGVQISFTNHSAPLLSSTQKMLQLLGYFPSHISAWRVYVTQQAQVSRFFRQVKPANPKHVRRFKEMV